MFLGRIFAKKAKNNPKTLFEVSKSVKKNRKIVVKSRNDVKSVCFFYMFYVTTQRYLKIST